MSTKAYAQTNTCVDIQSDLKIGMTSQSVMALQNYLAKSGFLTTKPTGYFGPLTKTAVEAYQKKHGLSQIGSVGPATRTLLNKGE